MSTVVRVGQEILVNTATADFQTSPQITALTNGGFVVTWQDNSHGAGGAGGDSSFHAVKAQVFAAGGLPVGTEFLVNTATDDDQFDPQITALANGGFVVTWTDDSRGLGGVGGDTIGLAVKAQVFAAGGTRVGTEIRVNTATLNDQEEVEITALVGGGFVVAWEDSSLGAGGAGGDASGIAMKAQVFAAGGLSVGGEIRVNTATAGDQFSAEITALANGGFVVTWRDDSAGVGGAGGDNSGSAVKAQVFAAGGTPVGTEIRVNTATAGDQFGAQIAALANGGFVVSWSDFSQGVGGAGGDTSNFAVKAQLFAAGGTPVGTEFLVNTATSGLQANPQITALSNGGFVVRWNDLSQGVGGAGGDTSSYALKAQVFAAGGARVGTEILVNTATAGDQFDAQFVALATGGFVVTWEDNSHGAGGATGDNSQQAVKAQAFAADGTPVGSEILVNTATAADQRSASITALSNGGFVVTWQDFSRGVGGTGGDTSGYAVKAQVFGLNIDQPQYLVGGPDPDTLTGGAGNDALDGKGGNDTLIGGQGDDLYYVQDTGDVIVENLNEGFDSVIAYVTYTLPANVEAIYTLAGGGATGNGLNNLLNAAYASSGQTLDGQGGNDILYGTVTGNDTLIGGSGSDALYGFGGNDTMQGGSGDDAYFVDDAGDVVQENPAEGTDTIYAAVNFTLPVNVEILVPYGAATSATGNGNANVLFGGNGTAALTLDGQGGDDSIYGSNFADTMIGGAGNDFFWGFLGNDTMQGGANDDVYIVEQAGDVVQENAGEGSDIVYAAVDYTLGANVETLFIYDNSVTPAPTSATGNAAGNAVINYNIAAGVTLDGAGGNDFVLGGAGADTIIGGSGIDTLTGSAGNDTFVLHPGEANGDTITDFAGNGAAAGDQLRFLGYGGGETFTNIDATHWQINYNGGASHEIVTFSNAASVHASEVLFV